MNMMLILAPPPHQPVQIALISNILRYARAITVHKKRTEARNLRPRLHVNESLGKKEEIRQPSWACAWRVQGEEGGVRMMIWHWEGLPRHILFFIIADRIVVKIGWARMAAREEGISHAKLPFLPALIKSRTESFFSYESVISSSQYQYMKNWWLSMEVTGCVHGCRCHLNFFPCSSQVLLDITFGYSPANRVLVLPSQTHSTRLTVVLLFHWCRRPIFSGQGKL